MNEEEKKTEITKIAFVRLGLGDVATTTGYSSTRRYLAVENVRCSWFSVVVVVTMLRR